MGDLPAHWTTATLEKCVDILDSLRVPVNSCEREKREGSIPYYGATGRVGWIDDFLFDEELLLIGEDGAPFFDKSKPISYVIKDKSWVNNHAHVLRSIKGITTNVFLKHYLNQFDFTGYVNGTTRLKLTQGSLRTIPVKIPPTNEQHRIVAKLEKLLAKVDACKERLEKIPAILKRFRQSVLAAACSGRLTADWRELNHSDANWKTGKLSEVAHSRLGKMLDKSKNQGALTPYLRNINVRWFGFDLKDFQNIRVTQKEAEALSILPGDVLVCEGGEPGRCAIWKGESGAFVYQKALHRIRVGSALLPEWVCYSLRTAADSGQLMNLFTGTTIKHLTGISLGELQLDLPPIEEQYEIVRRVEALFKIADDIKKRYQKAKVHVDKLTQSILAKAFRGELVPQDPNDEPAAELLKRIQAERKNQEAETRPGRKSTGRRVTY